MLGPPYIVYFIDMFQSHVGPLDVIGVEFRSRGTSAATRSRDSDHAKCSGSWQLIIRQVITLRQVFSDGSGRKSRIVID